MRTIAAVFVLLYRLIYGLVRTLIKSKVLLLIVIVVIVGSILISKYNNSNQSTVELPEYQKSAPSKDAASNILITDTRIYYVSTYTGEIPHITLFKYFVYNSNEWQYFEDNKGLQINNAKKIYER
jgi:hypothetical protein